MGKSTYLKVRSEHIDSLLEIMHEGASEVFYLFCQVRWIAFLPCLFTSLADLRRLPYLVAGDESYVAVRC